MRRNKSESASSTTFNRRGCYAAPDPKRGERVILATSKPGETRAEVQAWMKTKGASEFMRPSSVAVLEAIPILGSGKTNYVALTKDVSDSGSVAAKPR
jgi:acyl-[acyl-carrier-protein]-phospholipid O-acyltransferase / long-chain-fatty-acid--[acyl-carrier-protein] ligase